MIRKTVRRIWLVLNNICILKEHLAAALAGEVGSRHFFWEGDNSLI
jgi:hypothetical protein